LENLLESYKASVCSNSCADVYSKTFGRELHCKMQPQVQMTCIFLEA